MKKLLVLTALFLSFISIVTQADSTVAMTPQAGTFSDSWISKKPTHIWTFTNSVPVKAIITSLSGTGYVGFNYTCNGTTAHANAGIPVTCVTSGNITMVNDGTTPAGQAAGTLYFKFSK